MHYYDTQSVRGKTSEINGVKELTNNILQLNPGKAPGYDDITNTAIKQLPKTSIVTALAQIFTSCLRLAYFPDKRKIATIIMIPKPRKDHQKPEIHSSISLLTSMSNYLKKIIFEKL